MRKRKIEVTPLDIKRGIPNEEESCPVARAVARAFHKKVGTFTVGSGMIVKNNNTGLYVEYPQKVSEFIDKFDNGQAVKPFAFTMEY